MKKKICITSDCVCDLPEEILEKYEIPVIYFYIHTDKGCFRDMDEITAGNIIEYFENGGRYISTNAPKPDEYVEFFAKVLENCDEILHITIADSLSKSFEFAMEASQKFDGQVSVYNSGHLSTGIAHMVLKAVELVGENKTCEEIVEILDNMRDKISTSFIAENADYLYRNGRVSRIVKIFCSAFKVHPVLAVYDGKMKLKSIQVGDYSKSVLRYVRGELRKVTCIDKRVLFVTHVDCRVKLIGKVREVVEGQGEFENIIVSKASTTISSNCGANTLGVLFVRK